MDSTQIPAGAVVVGVDGSEHAQHALDWAAHHAACHHRPLALAYAQGVMSPYWVMHAGIDLRDMRESLQEAGEELLAQEAARVRAQYPSLEVTTTNAAADPRDLLLDLSETAEIVVVGSRGLGAVPSLLLGSVSTAITRHAHCPVVVIRPSSRVARGRGVLVAVDGTEHAVSTLEFAFQVASWQHATLTVVHCFWEATTDAAQQVADDDPAYDDLRMVISESMAGLREKYPDVQVEVSLARGLVDRTLLELARSADLLVVGARTRGPLGELLLGSVALTVVEHADCAVAVVPYPKV